MTIVRKLQTHLDRSPRRKFAIILAGLLSLLLVFDALAVIANWKFQQRKLEDDLVIASTGELRTLAERYTVHTHLALVCLAISDLDGLIQNRLESQREASSINDALNTLRGIVNGHGSGVVRGMVLPPAAVQAALPNLDRVQALWDELQWDGTLALRSEPIDLKHNEAIPKIIQASNALGAELRRIAVLLEGESIERLVLFRKSLVIVALVHVFVVIGVLMLCYRRIIVPFDLANQKLDLANQKLRKSYDDLVSATEAQKEAEAKLDEQRAQLIQSAKMASLGEMAAGIAHEINNPLAVIKGNADLITFRVKGNKFTLEQLTEYSQLISRTSKRIATIINGLRTFARETDDGHLQERSSVAEILDETLSFCRQRFKNRGIDLKVLPVGKDLILECRPVQISQVLLNLLNNAFDAVREEENSWVEIRAIDEGETIRITVTDSGRGIPAEVANRIMLPFFSTKGPGKGTGLGLSISRGIIDAHHGTLELDRGCPNTRFVVRLPKYQNHPEHALRSV